MWLWRWSFAHMLYTHNCACFRMGERSCVARSVAPVSPVCRGWAITTTRCIEPGSNVTFATRNSTRNRTYVGTWQRHTALEKPRSLNTRFATGDSRRSSTCDVTWRKRTRSTNLCSVVYVTCARRHVTKAHAMNESVYIKLDFSWVGMSLLCKRFHKSGICETSVQLVSTRHCHLHVYEGQSSGRDRPDATVILASH